MSRTIPGEVERRPVAIANYTGIVILEPYMPLGAIMINCQCDMSVVAK